MINKIDALFENIYNETHNYVDVEFKEGNRNVGKINEAKKIGLNKDSIKNAIEFRLALNLTGDSPLATK